MTDERAKELRRRLAAIDRRQVIRGPQIEDLEEIAEIKAELEAELTATYRPRGGRST